MAVAGGIDTSAKTIGGVIFGAVLIAVVINGLASSQSLSEKTSTEIDSRRLVGVLETIDQKDAAMIQIKFGRVYYVIEITNRTIKLIEGGTTVERPIAINSTLMNRTLTTTAQLCLKQNGTIWINKLCAPTGMEAPWQETAYDGPVPPADRPSGTVI